MSWMTARATLKMTETELTRRHSVRTVTHINTLARGDLNLGDFSSDPLVSQQTIQLAFFQRAVTVLPQAAPKHCWACSQRSGTLTRCSADRKLGHFQTEGQISGVGGVEVHMTLEDFVTSAFICDFAAHLSIPLQLVSSVSRSTNCCSLNVNNFPVAIDQAPSRDPAVEKYNAQRLCHL